MIKGNKIDYKHVARLLEGGAYISDIAAELGATAQGVFYGIKRYAEKHESVADLLDSLPPEQLRYYESNDGKALDSGKIWALHKAGWNAGRIAEDMRISTKDVIDVLRDLSSR